MRQHVSSSGFVVVQANHAVANRTFRVEGVNPLPAQQLDKFNEPYGNSHGRSLHWQETESYRLERIYVPVLWHSLKLLGEMKCRATVGRRRIRR